MGRLRQLVDTIWLLTRSWWCNRPFAMRDPSRVGSQHADTATDAAFWGRLPALNRGHPRRCTAPFQPSKGQQRISPAESSRRARPWPSVRDRSWSSDRSCSAVPPVGCKPCFCSASATSGFLSNAFTVRLSLRRWPAACARAHRVRTRCRYRCRAGQSLRQRRHVGRDGRSLRAPAASMLSLPAVTSGSATCTGRNIALIWPPSRSCVAPAVPL